MKIKSLVGAALVAAMTVSAPVFAQSGNTGGSGNLGSGTNGTTVDTIAFAVVGNLVIVSGMLPSGGEARIPLRALQARAQTAGPYGGIIAKILAKIAGGATTGTVSK